MRTVLLFCVLIMFSSCSGQSQTTEVNITATPDSGGKVVSQLDQKIWVIHQDRANRYWFGSNGSGVYCYDGKNLKQFTTKNGLASNSIRGIQEDTSGNIFFDTPSGVSKFDGKTFVSLKPVRSADNKWKSETGDLWFKGNGDIMGAYRYDGSSLYHLEFSSFSSEMIDPGYGVYSIYKDKQGSIWFGTLSSGVGRFDEASLKWIWEAELSVLADGRVPGVRSIIEDKDGNFWLSNILHRYRIFPNDSATRASIKYEKLGGIESTQQNVKIELPYFNSAVTDNENSCLWMTSYKEGVWKYDGKKLINYQIKDEGTDVLIVSIYKDNMGVLWLGTDNAGVYKFNGKIFEKFIL